MRVAAIGVGGAGGRIVDALTQDDESRSVSYLTGACVLDTDSSDAAALTSVPEDARHLFGQVETGGAGTNGDQVQAATIAEDDRTEMRRAADSAITSDATAILLITSLGGGTGSGATPHLADALREVYEQPIYTVSVLPAAHEEVPSENPARALQSLDRVVDAQIVFDNDTWLTRGDSIEEYTDELNQELAVRLGALFSAGETTAPESVGQRVVDASEIITTLNEGGLATIGYARHTIEDDHESADTSVLDRVRGLVSSTDTTVDEIEAINAVETTLRRAARRELSFDCPLDTATSGLLVVSGPPDWLHQSAVSDGQQWLSEEIDSVQMRTGDNPRPGSDHLGILVLLSGIQNTPRIKNLRTTTDSVTD